MCELFGFYASREKRLQPYLREFFHHSVRHPNGWGLATFENGEPDVRTEMISAEKSKILPDIVNSLPDSKLLLAHIRRATIGGVKPENCHPFVRRDVSGRTWTLMHNGTIFSGTELQPFRSIQKGDTDSERILLFLMELLREKTGENGRPLNRTQRFEAVEYLTRELSYRNKLNLMIFDGERLYVHMNMRGTLFVCQETESAMFSTTPLTPSGWEELPLNTLLAYEDGRLVQTGRSHCNEYLDVMGRITLDYNL